MLEHPGQQRGGRGLAVRAADHDRTFAADEKLRQQRRQRGIAQFVVEHVFRLGVAARNGIPDDHQIRLVSQVALVITVQHGEVLLLQEGRHRLINILVRAGDLEAFVHHGGRG